MYGKRLLVMCLLLLILPRMTWAEEPPTFMLIDLGPVLALHIDVDGNTIDPYIVGAAFMPEQVAALLYPTFRVIGTLEGGTRSSAVGMRDGLICGPSEVGDFGLFGHAFTFNIYTEEFTDLPTLAGPNLFATAASCNGTGGVAGFGEDSSQSQRLPHFWQDGVLRVLPTLGDDGVLQAVNVHTDCAGYVETADGALHAALWPGCGALLMDVHPPDAVRSLAVGLTDTGLLYGDLTMPGELPRGFVLLPEGLRVLPPLPGDDESHIHSTADGNLSVGRSIKFGPDAPSVVSRATIWIGSVPLDLLTLTGNAEGWEFEDARGINLANAVIVNGWYNGARRAALLIPATVVADHPPIVETPPEVIAPPMDTVTLLDEDIPSPDDDEVSVPGKRHQKRHHGHKERSMRFSKHHRH